MKSKYENLCNFKKEVRNLGVSGGLFCSYDKDRCILRYYFWGFDSCMENKLNDYGKMEKMIDREKFLNIRDKVNNVVDKYKDVLDLSEKDYLGTNIVYGCWEVNCLKN